jgi:N-acetylmuramic acid 6-phosphate etherase
MLEESIQKEAEDFLKISKQFRLGELPTETPHPKTKNLSADAKNNLPNAIETIKSIDIDVFLQLKLSISKLEELSLEIKNVLENNGRIFLCGCGATGRLSLALETIWRHKHKRSEIKERIISFMAGGDVALIHSVEKFEDFPEYGERQLVELGFNVNDLLISCTEGGETPFVIGATELAARVSKYNPYFLYCNPDEILINTTERSKRVIENSKIKKINLTVGPMALTGSTRMQATTILMYAVGLALWFYDRDFKLAEKELNTLFQFVQKCDFKFLEKFIVEESSIYKNNEYILYETDSALGISILTDTTERSPTFSLFPFENQNDSNKKASLSYLYFPHSSNAEVAWMDLLGRAPRTFHWPEVTDVTSSNRIMGFDFSHSLMKTRSQYTQSHNKLFKIYLNQENQVLSFRLNEIHHVIKTDGLNFLSIHLLLKIILNTHSTLVMGRLDRYQSNLMTWVRASNYKLIDRAVRYVSILLKQSGKDISYEELVKTCFELKDVIAKDQSLVLKMVNKYLD